MNIGSWKEKVRSLKRSVLVLYLAYRDARTPWYAKAFALLVLAYALSPIDLIPDFIPVLGYVDDLILVPLGMYLAWKMIPREVAEDCRARAATAVVDPRVKQAGTLLILGAWALVLWLIIRGVLSFFRGEGAGSG
jgi:uncharacterized membrane protein YkvA (DUF1232 family)